MPFAEFVLALAAVVLLDAVFVLWLVQRARRAGVRRLVLDARVSRRRS